MIFVGTAACENGVIGIIIRGSKSRIEFNRIRY